MNTCARCGIDVGNGGIDQAATLMDADLERGEMLRFYLCRTNGCATAARTPIEDATQSTPTA